MVCPSIGKATGIKAWPDGYGRSGVMIKFGVRQSFEWDGNVILEYLFEFHDQMLSDLRSLESAVKVEIRN